jgi:hypothetical protein
MADGDLLTLDSAATGGQGELAGQDKWSWKPPAAPAVRGATPQWVAGAYYSASDCAIRNSGLTFSTAVPKDTLFAVSRTFQQAGTLTKITEYLSGQGGSAKSLWVAVYRDDGNGAPGARIYSKEWNSAAIGNFAGTLLEETVALTVAAGETLWFATVNAADNNPQQMAITKNDLPGLMGLTNFDATGGTNPLRAFVVGYALAFPYAQPPATWSGSTKMLAGGGDCPQPLFKFTPS